MNQGGSAKGRPFLWSAVTDEEQGFSILSKGSGRGVIFSVKSAVFNVFVRHQKTGFRCIGTTGGDALIFEMGIA